MGNVSMRQDHLRRALESKGSKLNRMACLLKLASRSLQKFQNSKIVSLKDSLQKAKEKLKGYEVPKAKACKTDRTPTAVPVPPLSTHATHPCLNWFSTLKTLENHKQKSAKVMALQIPLYLPSREGPQRFQSCPN